MSVKTVIDKYPSCLNSLDTLFPIQELFVNYCDKRESNELFSTNFFIGAPTSSGKTGVCELFLSAHIVNCRMTKKVAYLAPMKALADERYYEWGRGDKGHPFKQLNVEILTSDYRNDADAENADIVIMTPEMLASRLANRYSDPSSFVHNIAAIVVDEAHLMGDAERGPNLEWALMLLTEVNPKCAMMLMSATLNNAPEVLELMTKLNGMESVSLTSDWRPTKLNVHVVSCASKGNSYDHYDEDSPTGRTIRLLVQHPDDQFLIFTPAKSAGYGIKKRLEESGIASEFHNADLGMAERRSIETRFNTGSIRVLLSTTTLAWGVNTAARRVIIHSVYRGTRQLSVYDVHQMCGRAGRAGFHDGGDAYVMVPSNVLSDWTELLSRPIEIISRFASPSDQGVYGCDIALLAAICHRRVSTLQEAEDWFSRSLFHSQEFRRSEQVGTRPKHVQHMIDRLLKYGCITQEVHGGVSTICPTSRGKIAVGFFIPPIYAYRFSAKLWAISNLTRPTDGDWADLIGGSDIWGPAYITKEDKAVIPEEVEAHGVQQSHLKTVATLWYMLSGNPVPSGFAGTRWAIMKDVERICTFLSTMINVEAIPIKASQIQDISDRIRYEVPDYLLPYVRNGYTKRQAINLYNSGKLPTRKGSKKKSLVRSEMTFEDL